MNVAISSITLIVFFFLPVLINLVREIYKKVANTFAKVEVLSVLYTSLDQYIYTLGHCASVRTLVLIDWRSLPRKSVGSPAPTFRVRGSMKDEKSFSKVRPRRKYNCTTLKLKSSRVCGIPCHSIPVCWNGSKQMHSNVLLIGEVVSEILKGVTPRLSKLYSS